MWSLKDFKQNRWLLRKCLKGQALLCLWIQITFIFVTGTGPVVLVGYPHLIIAASTLLTIADTLSCTGVHLVAEQLWANLSKTKPTYLILQSSLLKTPFCKRQVGLLLSFKAANKPWNQDCSEMASVYECITRMQPHRHLEAAQLKPPNGAWKSAQRCVIRKLSCCVVFPSSSSSPLSFESLTPTEWDYWLLPFCWAREQEAVG